MPIAHPKNDYQIPRGRVYIDLYDANEQLTGEIPMGNCPGFTLTVAAEKAEHFSSEEGMSEKDGSWPIKVTRTGALTCDNISARNVASWLSGTHALKTQDATPVDNEIRSVVPGRQYQLGATPANPLGVRNVSTVSIKSEDGQTSYVAGRDYNLSLETGRVQIIEGGQIAAGKVVFGYTPVAGQFESVMTGAKSDMTCAIRIVSDSAAGLDSDWYMPLVALTPTGEMPLITEDTKPVSMQFSLEVLKGPNAQAIYRDGRPVSTP
ncbi:hypothetical protein [Delftia sp. WSY_22]|uniref:phage tail tube protein n=1 Tax=Delftia sp. WSY_22 TaxID=3367213 RepID=UPI00370CB449